MSVLTPKRGREGSAVRGGKGKAQQDVGWDSESEEGEGEEGMGISPPKTMQFHIPQGRLMRTPGIFFPITLSLPLEPFQNPHVPFGLRWVLILCMI